VRILITSCKVFKLQEGAKIKFIPKTSEKLTTAELSKILVTASKKRPDARCCS
jgi:hypothetical protein